VGKEEVRKERDRDGEGRKVGTYKDSVPEPFNFRHLEFIWFDNYTSCTEKEREGEPMKHT